jgi:hypothetical protein
MSEARSPLDRFAFGPVAAVRPWLFAKALHLILALDVWHTLVGPAWRYGAAGFNVAHFAILDALPIPTREAYVGMLVLVGAMAFVAVALPRTPRALSIAITVLYTWGWSCSMLDSYQHHYLLSVLLVAACFFPQLSATDVFGWADEKAAAAPAPAQPTKRTKKKGVASAPRALTRPSAVVASIRSLGWTLVTSFAGVVYGFTAVSKAEPDWRSGEALRNITQNGATMPGPMHFAESLGLEPDTVFHLMGTGMIAVQIVCSLGYVTASLRDGASGPSARWLAGLGSLALALALSFHVGAEYIGLQIGWFSYYMIALACVALTPAGWLVALFSELTKPTRTRAPGTLSTTPMLAPALGLTAAGAAAFAGTEIDLPGAYGASALVGFAALVLGVGALLREPLRPQLGRAAGALGLAMLACVWSMTQGTERYDFYRFAGGDFRRRGEYENALEAYREANRYAPPGQSREERVHEMEEAIRRQGHTP